jgi:hypothetical protein
MAQNPWRLAADLWTICIKYINKTGAREGARLHSGTDER